MLLMSILLIGLTVAKICFLTLPWQWECQAKAIRDNQNNNTMWH